MIYRLLLLIALCAGAPQASHAQAQIGGVDGSIVASADNMRAVDDDGWRYRWHNGRWWYWTPAKSWVYWNDGHWFSHRASVVVPRAYASPYYAPRYYYGNPYRNWYGDRYWYGPRYRSGFRGYPRYGRGVYVGPGGVDIRF